MRLQFADSHSVAGLANGPQGAEHGRRECHGKWEDVGISAAGNDPYQCTGKRQTERNGTSRADSKGILRENLELISLIE